MKEKLFTLALGVAVPFFALTSCDDDDDSTMSMETAPEEDDAGDDGDDTDDVDDTDDGDDGGSDAECNLEGRIVRLESTQETSVESDIPQVGTITTTTVVDVTTTIEFLANEMMDVETVSTVQSVTVSNPLTGDTTTGAQDPIISNEVLPYECPEGDSDQPTSFTQVVDGITTEFELVYDSDTTGTYTYRSFGTNSQNQTVDVEGSGTFEWLQ